MPIFLLCHYSFAVCWAPPSLEQAVAAEHKGSSNLVKCLNPLNAVVLRYTCVGGSLLVKHSPM